MADYKCTIYIRVQAVSDNGEQIDCINKVCTINKYISNDQARNVVISVYHNCSHIVAFMVKRVRHTTTFDDVAGVVCSNVHKAVRVTKWYSF